LGAVVIIALFYKTSFSVWFLVITLTIFLLLLALRKKLPGWVYVIGGLLMWYCMHRSGIHATLSGILLAFALPYNKTVATDPGTQLRHTIRYPVNLVILPLFTLANTAIPLSSGWQDSLSSANSLGIFFGLVLGKPLGIFGFTLLSLAAGIGKMPPGMTRGGLFSLGMLAGIGFTMSIFIANLAFISPGGMVESSRIAILAASLMAAVAGSIAMWISTAKKGGSVSPVPG
jgi:Na+:H+ antiporter, NhaA family